MKKTVLSVLAIAALAQAPAALAKGNFSIDGRTDYVSADNDTKNSGDVNTAGFEMSYIRANFSGEATKGLNYTFRLSYGSDHNINPVDKTPSMLEMAYLTKSFSDSMSLHLGKQFVSHGGHEYQYDFMDVYQYSLVGNAMPAFATGATFEYMMANQKIHVQVMNADTAGTDTDNNAATDAINAQRNVAYGVTWFGSLMNNMIQPIFSYHIFPGAQKASNNYLTAGLKFDHSMFSIEGEYLKETKENAVSTIKDDENTSLVFLARYKAGKWSPFVKYFSDEAKLAGTKSYERTGYTVALECNHDKDIRWHLAYTSLSKEPVATTKVETSKIYAGVKFNFDL